LLSPRATRRLVEEYASRAKPADLAPELDQLTEREREVLRWSAEGKTAEETGTILGITERTVTYHVTSAMGKLDVTNKTQAVAKALLLKLV
jgi:LuxR family transcriptional regulator